MLATLTSLILASSCSGADENEPLDQSVEEATTNARGDALLEHSLALHADGVNDCAATSCFNGGLCIDGVNSFTCDCTGTGFQGALCQNNINDCTTSTCLNGGLCIDAINSFTCDCTGTGFQGALCQNNINDCTTSTCLNGGLCIDAINSFICDCAGTGFTGPRCAEPLG